MEAELIGGLPLLAGIKTRYVAVGLASILLGAIVLVHAHNGWLFTDPNGGWEYPVFLVVVPVAQALLGDGAFSAGALFGRGNG
jgi:putative oxidoreductase